MFDLSGAFRVRDQQFYASYYGFTHESEQWLDQAAYGLAEWNAEAVKAAQLIAVPGCYPTASLCALKPLQQAGLIAKGWQPIINAVSGVSGAGRKAAINTSFCEVSLNPTAPSITGTSRRSATTWARRCCSSPTLATMCAASWPPSMCSWRTA